MWIKKRHAVFIAIFKPIFLILDKLLYGFTPEKFKLEKGKPYLILSNHQTAFDQFMVNTSFSRLLYFVGSEDIFSHGFLSSLITFMVAPIPKSKSKKEFQTVRDCMQVIKEGGAVCIFPEGNRTYSGCTEHIDPVIARLAQSLKATLILYNIEGGFGVDPRWGNSRRKGKSRGFVRRVMTPEEIKGMSSEELFKIIKEELYVDSTKDNNIFKGKSRAEYLERALYWCPNCGQIGHLRSDKNELFCDNCVLEVEYTENLKLKVKRGECQHETIKEWYEAQKDFIRQIDVEKLSLEEPLFLDENVKILLSERGKPRKLVAEGTLKMYGDRLSLVTKTEEKIYKFDEITDIAPLNLTDLNMLIKGEIFKIKGQDRFNPLKYLNLFYHIKHVSEGKEDEFLGL